MFNWRWINCKSGRYRVVTVEECAKRFFERSEASSVAAEVRVKPVQLKWAADTGEDCSKYGFRWRNVDRDGHVYKCVTLEE